MLKSIEHRIKAAVYSLCRVFLKRGRTGCDRVNPAEISKVLFLRPEKIGDMVISLLVFDTLKAAYPHISVSVLASPRSYSLVKHDPRFDRVFLYRKRLFKDIRELREIRKERFDCIFDMIDDDSVTTLFYSQLASTDAIRIGIGKTQHAEFYDFNHVHDDGIGQHIIDNTLKLLGPFNLNGNSAVTIAPPHIAAEAAKRMNRFLDESWQESATLLGLNLSAGKPNRIWPEDNTVALCGELTAWRPDCRIVIIVAPGDRSRGERLQKQFAKQTLLIPDGTSLTEVSALISKLTLLVSPDTSLIHIARSFNVPVVGLYSRATKNFRRWRPYRQPDGAVVGDHVDNIHDITVEQVLERVQAVLRRVEAGE